MNAVTQGDQDPDNTLFVGALTKSLKTEIERDKCFATLEVQGATIKFKVDTGSQANIIPANKLEQLKPRPHVEKTSTRLMSYTGEDLPVCGQCTLQCRNRNLEFFIVDTQQEPVLSFQTSQDLGIVKIVLNVEISVTDYKTKYAKVFSGLGCFSKPYHIKVDKEIPPTVIPPTNLPAALRDRVKTTLDEMEKIEVIRRVDEPTEWVNVLVVIEKPKSQKLRICLDPRPLNKAIQREHFQLPTIEDITSRLTGAKVFSKLDANHGYWQIPLDKNSQHLTTFNSPFGRYCFQ